MLSTGGKQLPTYSDLISRAARPCVCGTKKIFFYSATRNHPLADCDKKNPCKKTHYPIACVKPNLLLCPTCRRSTAIPCRTVWAEKCDPCASNNVSQQRERLSHSLAKVNGWVEVTLTREGKLVYPWDLSKCNHLPSVKHSGPIGCKNFDSDVAVANANFTRDYNRWSQSVKRLYSNFPIEIIRVYEPQERGHLHAHVIVTGLPSIGLRRLRKELTKLIRRHHFGVQKSIKRVLKPTHADFVKVCNYLTKYLTKRSKRALLLDFKTGEIKFGGYRSVSATRGFTSMRTIRALRLDRYLKRNEETGIRNSSLARSAEKDPSPVLDIFNTDYTFRPPDGMYSR